MNIRSNNIVFYSMLYINTLSKTVKHILNPKCRINFSTTY